jgi:hypothetical protein
MHADRFATALLVLAVGATIAPAGAQPAPPPLVKYPEPQVRFNGELKRAGGATRVELKTWILAPGLRTERLALPKDAVIVIELHAGKLETLIGDKREPRRLGAVWRVLPGESIAFTTEDDSVTLTTLAIYQR